MVVELVKPNTNVPRGGAGRAALMTADCRTIARARPYGRYHDISNDDAPRQIVVVTPTSIPPMYCTEVRGNQRGRGLALLL